MIKNKNGIAPMRINVKGMIKLLESGIKDKSFKDKEYEEWLSDLKKLDKQGVEYIN
jgi:hypothetical protein|tara:strand:+ start:486 stop:653 length:168 start_codon:yes stop_codon:yes gene_type:complete